MRVRTLPQLRRILALAALVAACGDSGPTPVDPGAGTPATITAVTAQLQGPIANMTTSDPAVVIRDAGGRPLAGIAVTFAVTGGGGWTAAETVTTDADGRASTAWYMGPTPGAAQTLTASAHSLTATFTATTQPLVVGRSYFGASQYVEFIPGDLPIIVSAPHGGTLVPTAIPDRTGNVTTVRDTNTEELARDIGTEFHARSGRRPTLVIVRLHRRKLDANREIVEAAQGNAAAQRAWREYHGFIEATRAAIVAANREGFYIDLHGHGHDIQRLELGYTLTSSDLQQSNATLDGAAMVAKSSIRARVTASGLPHSQLIRGPNGLGTLFELNGFPTVPSAAQPHPAGAPFFSGGYNTERHSSRDGSLISGVQIEANMTGVRDHDANRRRFAAALLEVLRTWHPALFAAAAPAEPQAPIRLPNRRVQHLAR